MGFQYVPPITGAQVPVGTTDILIDPPPSVRLVNFHTLAMAQMAGSSLLTGARYVTVSHTWVIAQMNAQWFEDMTEQNNLDPTNPIYVFRGPAIVGIVTDSLLMEVVDLTHEDAFGQPMVWMLTCNSHELSSNVVPAT
jgi:hypothetical protein